MYLHVELVNTEVARSNNNAFLQKSCIPPHFIFFYAPFFPHLVFSSLSDILLTMLYLCKTPVWHFQQHLEVISSVSYLFDASLGEEWESSALCLFLIWVVLMFIFGVKQQQKYQNDTKTHIRDYCGVPY